jgi:hypothetical protein
MDYVANKGKVRNSYKILMVKIKRKRLSGRPSSGWNDSLT